MHRHFLDQNAAIANGSVSGVPINLKFLGVGDGLTVSPSGVSLCATYLLTYAE